MVSGQALAARAAAGEQRAERLTAADIFAAGAADPELDALIDEFVTELAFHLVNLAILVNPARIAVGGGMVRSWERIRPPLQHALRSGTPYPPELVVAHFPYDAPLLGAVAMAVDAAAGWAAPGQAPGPDPRGPGGTTADGRGDPIHHDTVTQLLEGLSHETP
jgi:glucokinase